MSGMLHMLGLARCFLSLSLSPRLSAIMRGYRGVKYSLFCLCYVFWVVSAVLIAVGVYAKIAKEKGVVDSLSVDPALFLICVGSFLFLLTFLGCSGSLRNAPCLLNAFLSLLLLVLVLQIVAGCVCFLFTDQVLERSERLLMRAVESYRDDPDLQNAIDFVQRKFGCCGVGGHGDWDRNPYFTCRHGNPGLEACGVPYSCCRRHGNQTVLNTMCGYGMQDQDPDRDRDQDRDRDRDWDRDQQIFTVGCLEQIRTWTRNNLLLVAGLTLAMLLLEVSLVVLALVQVCWIRRVQKRNRDRDRDRERDRSPSVWLPAFADFDYD
ncbi:tetraspanin-33 [Salarias fasciatus]|uniref:Tetraspanin-33 n=1 Tax=Salarias fasciatus TaxID=181472 RepID=A0A672GA00_SALFA|nr:tetraspanin-33-like [Salarias fasciatus]